jgi:hypothetical protein
MSTAPSTTASWRHIVADPRREAIRSILRDPWPEDAHPDTLRKKRRDYRGPRKPIMLRLPDPLAERVDDLAGRSGLSVNELMSLITYAYFDRHGLRDTR